MFEFLSIKTNTQIIDFVTNNLVLLAAVKYCIDYVCKKTPWAFDDDLPSFFGGLISSIKGKK